jgi:hypothetical protein
VPEVKPGGMRRRNSLKRTTLSLLIIVGAYACLWGYFQWKAQRVRAEVAKKLEPLFKESDELQKLGTVDLDPRSLTLAELEEKFQQPGLKLAGAQNTTKYGWLCGNDQCAIWAAFQVPYGQEVVPTAAPVLVLMNSPFLQAPHHLAIGGIYLGESGEEVKQFCQAHGFGLEAGKNRISWNKDWSAVWAERDDKVSLIVFTNDKALRNTIALEGQPARKRAGS